MVLDKKGLVLSINNSARRIFNCDNQEVLGCHYVSLNRGMPFKEAAEKGAFGNARRLRCWMDGRTYELFQRLLWRTARLPARLCW